MNNIKTIIFLGSGFDIDLGLKNSFVEYSNYYLNPMCGIEEWGDFENNLRQKVVDWYCKGMKYEEAKNINKVWQTYRKNLSYFFTQKSDDFILDKNRCAYKFFKEISNNSKIYSFNYTNPYDYIDLLKKHEIRHLHGRYYRDTYDKDFMVISQGYNLVLGIDYNCIPEEGMLNPYINAMVKNQQHGYMVTNLLRDLLNAENIVFFGFSMCKVDYVYFKEFFNSIEKGLTCCKNIYYITYQAKDFKNISCRLKDYGVNYDIILKNVSLMPIYTINGSKDVDFCNMLKYL